MRSAGAETNAVVLEGLILAHLRNVYETIDERGKVALGRSGLGGLTEVRTLGSIGDEYGVSRERIRQLEKRSKKLLMDALADGRPSWRYDVLASFHPSLVVSADHLASLFGGGMLGFSMVNPVAAAVGLDKLESYHNWFSADPELVHDQVESLRLDGPISKREWADKYAATGLPPSFLSRVIDRLGITEFGSLYIRSNSRRFDQVFAVLSEGPLPVEEIVSRSGLTPNSVRGALDHYGEFIPLAKSVWAIKGTVDGPQYRSTLPAILDIFEREGPQKFGDLARKVVEVHDVSEWRIKQCLDDYRIGYLNDGRIWLVSAGASRDAETEPVRPKYMTAQGDRSGIRFEVTFDHTRGSGFILNRWLCWWLNLRSTPQSITFDSDDGLDLKVTRTGSGASISTIKAALDLHGIVEGCEVVILLDRVSRRWFMRHVCMQGQCAAKSPARSCALK